MTKFELGGQLGFVGEDGFTSLPQTVLVRSLAALENAKDKNKMKTDWDGSSDKYARMDCQMAGKAGPGGAGIKTGEGNAGGEGIYGIHWPGISHHRGWACRPELTLGRSRHKRIPKNVSFRDDGYQGKDREYLRTRRTYVLKAVSESKRAISLCRYQNRLKTAGLEEDEATVKDDVQGLIHIGLNIAAGERECAWRGRDQRFYAATAQRAVQIRPAGNQGGSAENAEAYFSRIFIPGGFGLRQQTKPPV